MFGDNCNKKIVYHPLLRSMRIISEREKFNLMEYYRAAGTTIHLIYKDDLFCRHLNAQTGDVISISKEMCNIYRLVV
jgi:DNA-directed RNA polymerase subunit H (RpoH/RPB5)